MNVEPDLYDKQNQLQKQDAIVLLSEIENDPCLSNTNLIVDIGCGTGNISALFSKYISFKHLVAFDMSPEMVNFARNEYPCDNISYETASIDWQWEKLSEALKLSANSVDLVVSIHCFHWISDEQKLQSFSNVFQMLKPGAKAYLKFFSWSDLLPLQERITFDPKWKKYFADLYERESVSPNQLALEPQQVEVRRRRSSAPFEVFEAPSEEKRLQLWRSYCTQTGLEVKSSVITDRKFDFGNMKAFQGELKALCHFLPRIPTEERDSFLADYYDLIERSYINSNIASEAEGKSKNVVLSYQVLTLVIAKPI